MVVRLVCFWSSGRLHVERVASWAAASSVAQRRSQLLSLCLSVSAISQHRHHSRRCSERPTAPDASPRHR